MDRGSYHGDRIRLNTQGPTETLLAQLADIGHDLKSLNDRYCQMLYQQLGTYDAVATHTQIDRRTVKKYVVQLNTES